MATFTVGRHRGKIIQRVLKINASTKSLVERLCDLKIYAVSEKNYIDSICAPDKATLKAETHALQCTTAGPCKAIPTSLLGVGLGPDLVGIHSVSLAAAIELPRVRTRSTKGLRRSRQLGLLILHLCSSSLAYSVTKITYAGFCWTDLLTGLQRSGTDQPLSNCLRRVPLVLDSLLVFCASPTTSFARLKGFTVKVMNRRLELDVRMNPTLSPITTKCPLYNMFISIW